MIAIDGHDDIDGIDGDDGIEGDDGSDGDDDTVPGRVCLRPRLGHSRL